MPKARVKHCGAHSAPGPNNRVPGAVHAFPSHRTCDVRNRTLPSTNFTTIDMSGIRSKIRGRPAHPAGPTFLAYSRDGTKLVTAGTNSVVRVYETGSDGEPTNLDDCQDNNLAVAATVYQNLIPIIH